jgi:hypothetical protein
MFSSVSIGRHVPPQPATLLLILKIHQPIPALPAHERGAPKRQEGRREQVEEEDGDARICKFYLFLGILIFVFVLSFEDRSFEGFRVGDLPVAVGALMLGFPVEERGGKEMLDMSEFVAVAFGEEEILLMDNS